MIIRDLAAADWPRLYPIFRGITDAGETYAYPEGLGSGEAEHLWTAGSARTVVAANGDSVLGSARMGPNRPARGSHIATASFMVSPEARGRGVGRALGEDMVAWARAAGFRGIQFNAVVESNTSAVHLWRSLGFEILTTVPGAFEHPTLGFVGLHIMFLPLTQSSSAGGAGGETCVIRCASPHRHSGGAHSSPEAGYRNGA